MIANYQHEHMRAFYSLPNDRVRLPCSQLELGIGPYGHRRALLDAIATLSCQAQDAGPGLQPYPGAAEQTCREDDALRLLVLSTRCIRLALSLARKQTFYSIFIMLDFAV